ncbi:MAG: hypothetical protein LBB45_02355 [Methanobrevibacter sp.]|nr:hypothetical protein [Candidatus Methanovirga basalitermitum]
MNDGIVRILDICVSSSKIDFSEELIFKVSFDIIVMCVGFPFKLLFCQTHYA